MRTLTWLVFVSFLVWWGFANFNFDKAVTLTVRLDGVHRVPEKPAELREVSEARKVPVRACKGKEKARRGHDVATLARTDGWYQITDEPETRAFLPYVM